MSEEPKDEKQLTKSQEEGKTPLSEEQQEQQTITIMPTMIDDSEQVIEKKRDISAIIPKWDDPSENENAIALNSLDNELKSDGAISIGTINIDGEVTINPNKELPEPIDIEQRKKEKAKNKDSHKKTKKKKSNKAAQKIQNTTSLIAIIVIAFLGVFFYWYKTHPTEMDFKPLTVEVELGDGLPIGASNYVKPGIGNYVDGLEYVIDTKDVNVDEVGDYQFTVKYKDVTKTGVVIIKDTTNPVLEVRNITVVEGSNINPGDFVTDCFDYSGCNYSFQDPETESKAKTAGSYIIFVTATDAHKNTATKQASLTVEAPGATRKYVKKLPFDFNTGFELTEQYELHFASYDTESTLVRGVHTKSQLYQSEEKYLEARKTYTGEAGYNCDDANKTITFTETISTVGSNYSDLNDIENYLSREGYTLR